MEKDTFSNKNLGTGSFVELASFTASGAKMIITRVRFDLLAGNYEEYEVRFSITPNGGSERELVGSPWSMADASEGRYIHTCKLYLENGDVLKAKAKNLSDSGDAAVAGEVCWVDVTPLQASDVNAECDQALADYDGPTNAEMIARTKATADYADKTTLDAVKTKTDNLPAAPAAVGDIPTVGAIDTELTSGHGAGSWSSGSGSGDVEVTHNYGGVDNLRYVHDSAGVDGGTIRAYLKSEYDAGNYTIRGNAVTGSDGRWIAPIYLDADTYYLFFSKSGVYATTKVEVTVT